MFWYSDQMNGLGWVLMVFAMVAFWGLLFTSVFSLSRPGGFGRASRVRQSESATPERLLAGRFARGEIDEPEYTGRLAAMHGAPRS